MAHILVIDDDDMMIELISDLLIDEGHTVSAASDGEAGLAEARRVCPDLVLVDLNMPGLDGRAVASRLRGGPSTAGVPVAALTASASAGGLDDIFDAVIAKPVSPGPLAAAVDRLLAR